MTLITFAHYQDTPIGLFFDQILYWYGIALIVMMYTGLVYVWAILCKANMMPIHSVFGENRARFLIGTNVLLCILMIPFPVSSISNLSYDLFLLIMNPLLTILILTLIVLVSVYGYRVYK
jgi:hypothetical protein